MNNYKNSYRHLNGKRNVTGKNINYYRTKINMSAQKLPDKLMIEEELDIHAQAIYAIEAGKRTVADYELGLIAKALGVTSDILLEPFLEYVREENK